MPAPTWFGHFNRQVTNRFMAHVTRRAPGFGVIVHHGRRSGRTYPTPVNIFRRPDGYAITLDRTDSDWLKMSWPREDVSWSREVRWSASLPLASSTTRRSSSCRACFAQ